MNSDLSKICKVHGNLSQDDIYLSPSDNALRCIPCAKITLKKQQSDRRAKTKLKREQEKKIKDSFVGPEAPFKDCMYHGVLSIKDILIHKKITKKDGGLSFYCRICRKSRKRKEASKEKKGQEHFIKNTSKTNVCCYVCKKLKNLTGFTRGNLMRERCICRECVSKSNKKSRYNFIRQRLVSKYGITFDDYEIMKKNQHNLCGICNKKETKLSRTGEVVSLCVDHNHKTGEIRKLLCSKCNLMIGYALESKETLMLAIKYLEEFEYA